MSDEPFDSDDASTANQSEPFGVGEMGLTSKLQWGGLVVLVVVALVTAIQFYTSTLRAIQVWVGPGYRPLFMMAFNLAALLLAVAGISLLARRLETPSA